MKKHYSFYKQIINRQRGHSALCQPKEKSILQPRQQRYEHGFSGHFNSTIRTKKSAEIFHIFLAVIILCVYLYILINLKSTFPRLAEALFTSYYKCRKARYSLQVVLALPFISVICFLFPRWLMTRFSPRTRFLGEPIITKGGWCLLGYLLLALTAVAFLGFA